MEIAIFVLFGLFLIVVLFGLFVYQQFTIKNLSDSDEKIAEFSLKNSNVVLNRLEALEEKTKALEEKIKALVEVAEDLKLLMELEGDSSRYVKGK